MKKLYVLISNDLTPSQKAVQAGHVVSVIASKCPDINWRNQTFVYLNSTKFQMAKMVNKLCVHDIDYEQFQEPDLDNKTTAIACLHGGNLFDKFNLI